MAYINACISFTDKRDLDRIKRAAKLAKLTVSAFMREAAGRAADRTLAIESGKPRKTKAA